MSFKFLSLLFIAVASADPLIKVLGKGVCTPCNPTGATGTNPPGVGPDLNNLYIDVLQSVKDIHFSKRWIDVVEARDDAFCCHESIDCVNVQNLNIPMCYDKFTTQFSFSDGSWGSLTTGEYEANDGGKANLLTGNYTQASGQTGDIYSKNESEKPNTSTLSVPPQFTGTGVGSAIPASQLGSIILITTTIPGTLITSATVIPASTVYDGTSAIATLPAKTITAATSIAPATAVITETPKTSNSKGAAGQVGANTTMPFAMWIFTSLMYAIYAL